MTILLRGISAFYLFYPADPVPARAGQSILSKIFLATGNTETTDVTAFFSLLFLLTLC
jgi:hypothetical protein